eukprot:1141712-Pelagomonas_calceolata.AAC.2
MVCQGSFLWALLARAMWFPVCPCLHMPCGWQCALWGLQKGMLCGVVRTFRFEGMSVSGGADASVVGTIIAEQL